VVEVEVRKWLRQQSKYFYAAGFGALVKLMHKRISVGGGYVEKLTFFPGSIIMFCVLYPFLPYLLIRPRRCGVIKENMKHYVACNDGAPDTDTNVIRFLCELVLRGETQSDR
jgi:hypothetical protein